MNILLSYNVELKCHLSQDNGLDERERSNHKKAVAPSVFENCQPNLVCKFSYASAYRKYQNVQFNHYRVKSH